MTTVIEQLESMTLSQLSSCLGRHDLDINIRRYVARRLARSGDKSYLPALRDAAKREPDNLVQGDLEHAIRVLSGECEW